MTQRIKGIGLIALIVSLLSGLTGFVLDSKDIINLIKPKSGETVEKIQEKTADRNQEQNAEKMYIEKKDDGLTSTSVEQLTGIEPVQSNYIVDFLNTREILSSENSTALLIRYNSTVHSNIEEKISQSLLEKGIYSSTTLLSSRQDNFDFFFNANQKWLSEIKISDFTPSYIVGRLTEKITKSSANSKITIVNLSFNGRFVDTKIYRVVPISMSKESSSFNEEMAFTNVCRELSDSIATLTKSLMAE